MACIEIVIDSLEELHAECKRDNGIRGLFICVLNGEGDLDKAIPVIRKRMREHE